jgi:hypothetical protein
MDTLSGIGVTLFGRLRQLSTWPVIALDGGMGFATAIGVAGARFASADQSGGVADVTDPPAPGQRLVITDIRFSSDTALRLDFIDEGNSAVFFSEYVGANGSGQITLRGKVKLSTADTKLGVLASVPGNIAVTVAYYSEA